MHAAPYLLQTYNLPDEHVAAYLKSRDVNTMIGKMKEKEQLHEHPDVARFLEWKDKLQVRGRQAPC